MTREEALKLLTGGPEGVAEWNRRLVGEGGIPSLSRAYLRGAALREAGLPGADLSDAELSDADLCEAWLSGADLRQANLGRAKLRKAILGRASLSRAKLPEADLREADLSRANLCEAGLSGANLRRADLFKANLSRAALHEADLREANLSGANLSEAYLRRAYLCEADLSEANLRDANLIGADLTGAKLIGANFTCATAQDTVFACDLNETIGLEEIHHLGSSTVAISTVLSFKDDLPEKFLRGCGLRDEEIAYFRSQVGKPIRFYKCFISYSSKDETFATRLYNDFQGCGIRCWKWNEDARTGQNLWCEIDTAIRKFDKLVLIASESSLKSPYVADEVERAIQKEREREAKANNGEWVGDTNVLFPVRLDDYILNGWKHERRADVIKKVIADARGWDTDHAVYKRVLDKLVKDLKM